MISLLKPNFKKLVLAIALLAVILIFWFPVTETYYNDIVRYKYELGRPVGEDPVVIGTSITFRPIFGQKSQSWMSVGGTKSSTYVPYLVLEVVGVYLASCLLIYLYNKFKTKS